jgi:hypothetical protein
MRRSRATLIMLLAAVAVALTAAPTAPADSFQKIFLDYQRTGRVDGCKYSAREIAAAQRQVPNDIEQYAPDFPAALQAAAEQRASGRCRKGAQTAAPVPPTTAAPPPAAPQPPPAPGQARAPAAAPPPPPAPPTPQPTPDPVVAPVAADNAIPTAVRQSADVEPPAALLALAILGGLLGIFALAWGTARWWAWEPPWAARAHHAGAEAGWRAGAVWDEFSDWVRSGR